MTTAPVAEPSGPEITGLVSAQAHATGMAPAYAATAAGTAAFAGGHSVDGPAVAALAHPRLPPGATVASTAVPASPDSVYARWSEAERAAADAMEERYNAAARCGLAELVHTTYTRVAPDEGLHRFVTLYRRQLEDIDRGDLAGGAARARLVRAKLADVEREQELRSALAATWQASETGTHCYSAYALRGGLAAVVHHGAAPPSYHLAVMLDHTNWARGLPHALAWR